MAEVIKRIIVEVDSDTKKLTKGFKKVNKEVGFLTKGVKRLGVALVAAFGARALFSGFKQTLRLTDELIKKAKGFGFTVNEYQRLVFALDQVGISAGSAKVAIGDFQKRLSKAVAGTSPQFAKAFAQAGLDINALSRMNPAAAFQAALTHLATLRGDPRLAGFTGAVFEEQSGKDVKQIIELWEDFTKAREDHSKKVGELTRDEVRSIAKLSGNYKLLNAQIEMMRAKIVAKAAPDIIDAIESISDSGAFEAITTEVTKLIKELNLLIGDIKWLGNVISNIPGFESFKSLTGKSILTPGFLTPTGSSAELLKWAFREERKPGGWFGGNAPNITNGKLAPSPPPSLAKYPSGSWQPADTNYTTNVTIKAARGSYEITPAEARRIKKAFDQVSNEAR